jgi:hypothetical protein
MGLSTIFWSNIISSLLPSVFHLMKTLPFPRVGCTIIQRHLLKKKKNLYKPSIRLNSYIPIRKSSVLMSISMLSKTRILWNHCLRWLWCSWIRLWDHITLRRRYRGIFMLSGRREFFRVIFRYWRTGVKALSRLMKIQKLFIKLVRSRRDKRSKKWWEIKILVTSWTWSVSSNLCISE